MPESGAGIAACTTTLRSTARWRASTESSTPAETPSSTWSFISGSGQSCWSRWRGERSHAEGSAERGFPVQMTQGRNGIRVAAVIKGVLRRGGGTEGRAGSAATTVGGSLVGALCAFAAAIVAARTLKSNEFAAFGVGLAVHSLCVQLADFGLGTVAITELATGKGGQGHPLAGTLRPLAVRRLGTAIGLGTAITLVALVIPALEPYRLAILVGAGGAVFWSMDQFF